MKPHRGPLLKYKSERLIYGPKIRTSNLQSQHTTHKISMLQLIQNAQIQRLVDRRRRDGEERKNLRWTDMKKEGQGWGTGRGG